MNQKNIDSVDYQEILDTLGVYALVLDQNFCLLQTSNLFKKLFSLDGDKNRGKSIFDFSFGRYLDPLKETLLKTSANGESITQGIMTEDGVFYRLTISRLQNSIEHGPLFIIGLIDIDEAKKNEIFIEDRPMPILDLGF
jgi:hypothetical protein